MQRALVTVRRSDETVSRDLELPAETEAARLGKLIARALGWESGDNPQLSYRIEIRHLGRALHPQETLAASGSWDGAILVIHPVGSFAPGTAPPPSGMNPNTPPTAPKQPTQPPVAPPKPVQPSAGFAWKRLDDTD